MAEINAHANFQEIGSLYFTIQIHCIAFVVLILHR